MTKDIVMLHGANEGGWCFDKFRAVFEGLGWTCPAPDLIGHGTKAADAAKTLVGVGMADYRVELAAFLKTVPPQPVLIGHSMGAVLAQQLAAQGLRRFGPEAGRAFFELFFWMFDRTGATVVDTNAVSCPVLCLVGADDKIVSPQAARATASAYRHATFLELQS